MVNDTILCFALYHGLFSGIQVDLDVRFAETQVGVRRRVDVLSESGSDHHYPLEEPAVGRAKDQQLYYTFGRRVLLPVRFAEASES